MKGLGIRRLHGEGSGSARAVCPRVGCHHMAASSEPAPLYLPVCPNRARAVPACRMQLSPAPAHPVRRSLPLQVCRAGVGRPRKIWLTRHGESQFNTMGKIGGNSSLRLVWARRFFGGGFQGKAACEGALVQSSRVPSTQFPTTGIFFVHPF